MRSAQQATLVIVVIGLAVMATPGHAQPDAQSKREAMYYRYLEFPSLVKGGSIEPHWLADGSSFWYAEGAPENTVIYKVDPKTNTKTPLFDIARLRKALTPLLGNEPPFKGLPFEQFTFVDEGEKAVKFTVEDIGFVVQLDTYAITRVPILSEEEKKRVVPQAGEVPSPDGRLLAGIKDYNLWLRSTDDGRSVVLIEDGIKDYEWVARKWWGNRWALWSPWSPDSLKLVGKKVDYRKVSTTLIVHYLKGTEEVTWEYQPKPGEPIPRIELVILDILSKRRVRVETGKEPDQYIMILGWRPDGSELLVFRLDREFKRLELLAASPVDGSTRVVLTETQKTFIHMPWYRPLGLTLLDGGKRFLWLSERDGWNHIYLYNTNGDLIRQLTEGAFPVVQLVAVDEVEGWVYFLAHGDRQRPYDTHLYRVDLEGRHFKQLTEATGRHAIQFAPSKDYFLDTHSNVDRLPVVELRRADGNLMQVLSKADTDVLAELKWYPPEEFAVMAADGETDLHGVLYKPYDFDASKSYPVIEIIVARPDVAVNEILRIHSLEGEALAQLGFIVFLLDGRGTPERGKAFHDVVYRNVGRNEIPDHAAALKQLAAKRPYMDLGRVGIYGASYGGYFAIRAMLLAPDVYHVGVARAPLVDLYDGWADLTVLHMGLPKNNQRGYDYASNLRFAENLKGKLLLIHGTSDTSVPISHTIKMVDALIRAGKPYNLMILPDEDHDLTVAATKYTREAIRRYFQEHLQP